VVVVGTTADHRADDIGLKAGDIIHSVNARPVANVDALRTVLRGLKPGDAAALQVERNGRLTFFSFEIE
jgi:S1-C subfamily serine protease